MKISVIIPVYKGEKFIAEQLASLAAQTLPPDEVLIGDDSGTDDATLQAIEKFCSTSKLPFELHYSRNPQPLGINKNFKHLSEKVSGDLCFFCDQDDVWLPDKIKVMAEAFENSPHAGAVCCFSTITDESLVPWPVQPVVSESVLSAILQSPEKIFRAFLAERITAAGHNIALSRKMLALIPDWQEYALYDYWLLQCCALAEKLILIPRKMTLHRVHSANATISEKNNVKSPLLARVFSIVTNTDRQKEFEDLLRKTKSLLEHVEDSRLKEEVPVQNLHLLRKTVSFLQLRIKQRKKNIVCRLFLSPFLLKGYFSYANGWRSFLRDLAGM